MAPATNLETTRLLSENPSASEATHSDSGSSNFFAVPKDAPRERALAATIPEDYIGYVLPLACTAAFAIAATSATTIFAYADIVCVDPVHCKDDEQSRYSGTVAVSTTIANVFGIIAVGILRQWAESHPRLGLCFWLVCRSLGVAVLAVGVLCRSIYVAIAGRVFDGLATDNILHYTLAAIYIRTNVPGRFSRLMGTSLALYMIGMPVSPTLVTLLPNFFFSFILAIAVLGLSLVYLLVFIPVTTPEPYDVNEDENSSEASPKPTITDRVPFFDPVLYFYREPVVLLPGLAIFFYNSAQAYLFPAIMVHAALKFGFTSTENGYIISIAAGTSSVYLLVVSYVLPKVYSRLRPEKPEDPDEIARADCTDSEEPPKVGYRHTSDLFYASISMASQFVVLPLLALVNTSGELYGLVVFIALGLAAPSFIKSYAVTIASVGDSALAGLAVMESVGGLASPIILGTFQSVVGQGGVFFIASGLVGAAILSLAISVFVK
ncbi:hypothetical protein F4805DRAFT_172091 [Annulohypoxylon moriforme]|nr:hypothetical protein F4805DRAFT_172091 [Annulohypoxylon moriforme]